MAQWILGEGYKEIARFKSPRDLAEYLRTMDETELIEDEVELSITVEDD
jgi:hypothetical protein